MKGHTSELLIRELRIWEIPTLLRFQQINDYVAIPEQVVKLESIIYSILKALWHRKRLATLVAERDGEIVGYISLVFGKYKKFQGNAYIMGAAVKESERGQGVGTLLFNKIEEYALEHSARRIEFEVFSRNTEALKLYQRLGYVVEGTKRRAVEWDGGFDDLIFMAKFIG